MTRGLPGVVVIGAGVSGLTTAVVLAEQGFHVRVWAAAAAPEITSCAAGAVWGPYLAAHERVGAWSHESLIEFQKLAESDRPTGVYLVSGIEASRHHEEIPSWASDVPGFTTVRPEDLPAGFVSGWRYTVPIIDMPTYLRYLTDRLAEAGVRIELRTITSLSDAASSGDPAVPIVVNCSGIGARHLVPDPALTAIRGDVLVVANPGLTDYFAEISEDEQMTYVLPQGEHVVLGGTAFADRYDTAPDPALAAAMLQRCAAVEPRLSGAEIIEHRVGLRPARDHIRVEVEPPTAPGRPTIVHNYGHGGGGVTLSWGCAHEVRSLIRTLV
jgi:D-amino-acid oxidase